MRLVNESDLQRLADRESIHDLLVRLALAQDAKDWTALGDCFVADARYVHPGGELHGAWAWCALAAVLFGARPAGRAVDSEGTGSLGAGAASGRAWPMRSDCDRGAARREGVGRPGRRVGLVAVCCCARRRR